MPAVAPPRRRTSTRAILGITVGVLASLGAGCQREPSPTESPQTNRSSPSTNPAPTGTSNSATAAAQAGPAPTGMVWVPGGTFRMGTDTGAPDERPAHSVTVHGFWMDRTEVTNEEFARFVQATGYVTVAEKAPDAKSFPDAPPENLVPGAGVFDPAPDIDSLENHLAWWRWQPGANWRHPEGPASDVLSRTNHPVVHVAWDDALAYARWAGKRLPTEAEWECAARGGLAGQEYSWGADAPSAGRANLWQGRFPHINTAADGFRGSAPVASFPANGFGLFDIAGNVWEWCADWYRPDTYANSAAENPRGPADSFDPMEPGVPKKVLRGGSYLCSDVYCSGYRVSARMKSSPDTGLAHTGFRCVKDP